MAVLNPGLDPERGATGLDVESPSGTVYVDNVDRIAGYKSSGEPLPQPSFGEGHITQGSGVAVDSSTGTVYVVDEATDEVHRLRRDSGPRRRNRRGVGTARGRRGNIEQDRQSTRRNGDRMRRRIRTDCRLRSDGALFDYAVRWQRRSR